MSFPISQHLLDGQVIPALPLALKANRTWDERRQQAVLRYYIDAGSGGLAVGVHSTQFAIRDPKVGLFQPILELAAATAKSWNKRRAGSIALISGLCGATPQAVKEASLAASLGYHAGLLNIGSPSLGDEKAVLAHCRTVARTLPLIGFYLQTAVGGRVYSYNFWRKFAEIPGLVGIKIAPFNRYRTIDVVRAVIDAGRDDVALYTGNDDNIIGDLITRFRFNGKTRWIDGGLLGQWGVGTRQAVRLLRDLRAVREKGPIPSIWLTRNAELTDANAALFDAANNFAGCIPGIHEVLRRQGLFSTTATLDPVEKLSPGQSAEITRTNKAYPWLSDDDYVAANLDRWLS